jgi:acetyl esterase
MIMYLLKVIGARSLRLIVSLILKLKSPPQKALPKAAICITLAKIVESDKSKKNKKARQIPIDVYLPKNTSKGKDTELPVVVNLHGSGFLLNTFGDDAPFCQLIADRVECVVLDVSYGKAPERPFPNADEDIDSILEWVLEKKEIEKKLGGIRIASNRVGITGFSSGGKLALTSCVRAKGKDRFNSIKAVVAFYPS